MIVQLDLEQAFYSPQYAPRKLNVC